MFITFKRKYLRKKRDLKDVNKLGTSSEVVLKAQKSFRQYEFMKWLDDFVASRQGKNNLPSRGSNVEEDENGEEMTQNCSKMKTHPQFCLKKVQSYKRI